MDVNVEPRGKLSWDKDHVSVNRFIRLENYYNNN